jgi:hypothetical protein
VSIRKSVTPDYLICLDDGKKFKSLKRRLAKIGLTPDQYRVKWNLPYDYPMVAPNYAVTEIGAGQKDRVGSKETRRPQERPGGRPRAWSVEEQRTRALIRRAVVCRFRWSREAARRPVAGVGDDVGNDDRADEWVRGTGGRIEGRGNSDFSGNERLGLFGVVHGPLAIRPSDFAERDCHVRAKALGRSRAALEGSHQTTAHPARPRPPPRLELRPLTAPSRRKNGLP